MFSMYNINIYREEKGIYIYIYISFLVSIILTVLSLGPEGVVLDVQNTY